MFFAEFTSVFAGSAQRGRKLAVIGLVCDKNAALFHKVQRKFQKNGQRCHGAGKHDVETLSFVHTLLRPLCKGEKVFNPEFFCDARDKSSLFRCGIKSRDGDVLSYYRKRHGRESRSRPDIATLCAFGNKRCGGNAVQEMFFQKSVRVRY